MKEKEIELQKEVEKLEKNIQDKIDKATEDVALKSDLEGIKKEVEDITDIVKKMGKPKGVVSQKSQLVEDLDEYLQSQSFKDFANGSAKSAGQVKTTISATSNFVGQSAIGTSTSEDLIAKDEASLRNVIPVIDVEDEGYLAHAYLEVTKLNRDAQMLSENGELTDSALELTEKVASISRIGHRYMISKRMLRSVSVLRNYIIKMLESGLTIAENYNLIFGRGEGNQVKGILKHAKTESLITNFVYEIDQNSLVETNPFTRVGSENATMIKFKVGLPKLKTGMKVVIAGVGTATEYNNTWAIEVLNDNTITIPKYQASAVLTSVTFKFKYDTAGSKDFANQLDAIETIEKFQTVAHLAPNGIVVHPLQIDKFKGIKDKVGRKIFNDYVNGDKIGGMTIFQNSAIPMGKALIGDFENGCKLLDCQKAFVELAEDVTTKSKNQVALLIQEEIIFAVEIPEAFMYADLDTVVSHLDSGASLDVSIVSPLTDDGEAIVIDEKGA